MKERFNSTLSGTLMNITRLASQPIGNFLDDGPR
jgi:hypothetical protein